MFDGLELFPDGPEPDVAVPAAGGDEVRVVEGGQGAHPVRLPVHRVHTVALLNLQSKQSNKNSYILAAEKGKSFL